MINNSMGNIDVLIKVYLLNVLIHKRLK